MMQTLIIVMIVLLIAFTGVMVAIMRIESEADDEIERESGEEPADRSEGESGEQE